MRSSSSRPAWTRHGDPFALYTWTLHAHQRVFSIEKILGRARALPRFPGIRPKSSLRPFLVPFYDGNRNLLWGGVSEDCKIPTWATSDLVVKGVPRTEEAPKVFTPQPNILRSSETRKFVGWKRPDRSWSSARGWRKRRSGGSVPDTLVGPATTCYVYYCYCHAYHEFLLSLLLSL